MLVLTRKPNQQVRIGNDIVVTVVKVRGNTIRLGIEAPQDVRVMRSELTPKTEIELTLSTEDLDDSVTEIKNLIGQVDSVVCEESSETPSKTDSKKPTARQVYPGKTHRAMDDSRFEDSPLCHRPLAKQVEARKAQSAKSELSDKAASKSPVITKFPGVA